MSSSRCDFCHIPHRRLGQVRFHPFYHWRIELACVHGSHLLLRQPTFKRFRNCHRRLAHRNIRKVATSDSMERGGVTVYLVRISAGLSVKRSIQSKYELQTEQPGARYILAGAIEKIVQTRLLWCTQHETRADEPLCELVFLAPIYTSIETALSSLAKADLNEELLLASSQ